MVLKLNQLEHVVVLFDGSKLSLGLRNLSVHAPRGLMAIDLLLIGLDAPLDLLLFELDIPILLGLSIDLPFPVTLNGSKLLILHSQLFV